MPRWLPATEPETIKLVWLAAVNVQVSLVVSKPLAVTTTVPSPLLEPEVTALTEATVPVFSVSLVTSTVTVSDAPASPFRSVSVTCSFNVSPAWYVVVTASELSKNCKLAGH